MKTVKITNGEVVLKDFCTRKLRKEINKALYENVEMEKDGGIRGFCPSSMDKANDVAMLGMIDSITINGEDKPVSIDTIDNLSDKDVDLIIEEVNKTTSKEVPNA